MAQQLSEKEQAEFTFGGKALKEQGMALVTSHTPKEWKAAFNATATQMSTWDIPFTAEDVVAVIGFPPNHRNAIGAAMSGFAKRNKLTRVGYVQAKRGSRHAGMIAQWIKK